MPKQMPSPSMAGPPALLTDEAPSATVATCARMVNMPLGYRWPSLAA